MKPKLGVGVGEQVMLDSPVDDILLIIEMRLIGWK